MNVLLIIVAALALVIVAILVLAAGKPDSFALKRDAVIAAPPERVFAVIDDFHAWPTWSPWEKLDPDMQRKHSGVASGKGAVYEWEGNKKVGKGRMEITESVPSSKVVLDLHFMAPWEARNVTEFKLEPTGEGTRVTWAMTGPSPFMSKVMSVFISMDALVGKDFEQGLANMKRAVEAS